MNSVQNRRVGLGRVDLCGGCGPGLENRVGVYLFWSAG